MRATQRRVSVPWPQACLSSPGSACSCQPRVKPPANAPAGEPLVWARGAAQGFAAGHVLQAVSAVAAWAPATPEPLPRWGAAAAPELGAAARMAGSLLGEGPVRGGDLLLPDWARLPNSEPADSDSSAGTEADARGLGKRTYLQSGFGEPAGGQPQASPPGTPPLGYLGAAPIAPSSSGCYTEAALGLAPAAAAPETPVVLARSHRREAGRVLGLGGPSRRRTV